MFPRRVEQVTLVASWHPSGYSLRIAARLEGLQWSADAWVDYDSLSAAELVDVLLAELLK
jgi:hypothetical protein